MRNNFPICLPSDKADAVESTAHEIFHTIFPFYVGTNESGVNLDWFWKNCFFEKRVPDSIVCRAAGASSVTLTFAAAKTGETVGIGNSLRCGYKQGK